MYSGLSFAALAQLFVCKYACHATLHMAMLFVSLSLCMSKIRENDCERTLSNNSPL